MFVPFVVKSYRSKIFRQTTPYFEAILTKQNPRAKEAMSIH